MEESTSTNVTDSPAPSNVIEFPIKNKNLAVAGNATLEEMIEKAAQNKVDFVNFIAAEMIEELFFKLSMLGFNFEDESYTKDGVFVIEALKSLLLKTMGIEHSMQMAAEKLIDLENSADIDIEDD